MQAFIDYLNGRTADSAFTGILRDEVDTRNQDEEWRGGHMTLEEEIREREDIKYRQGIEHGIEQGKLQTVFDLVHDEVIDEVTASTRTGMTPAEFRKKMAEYLEEHGA